MFSNFSRAERNYLLKPDPESYSETIEVDILEVIDDKPIWLNFYYTVEADNENDFEDKLNEAEKIIDEAQKIAMEGLTKAATHLKSHFDKLGLEIKEI